MRESLQFLKHESISTLLFSIPTQAKTLASASAPIVKSESELREELLESLSYEEDSVENFYWNAEYNYREQMEYGDPSNPDSVYMAMEAMMDSTNIPAFIHATRLMEEGLFPEAIQALEDITPQHSWEEVRKATLLIYAREFAWGRLEADSQYELEQLNILSPFYFGEGIFSSRVMTDYIALFEGAAYKGEFEQSSEEAELFVYPNPTRDYIYVLKSRGQQEHLSLTLRNSIGVVVKKLDMRELDTYVKVDISNVIPGIYFLEVDNGTNKEVYCVVVQ